MDADEIDQPILDERHVLVLRVEQLAHRERDAGLLAQQAEVIVVLRRERVLEEEQAIRLERLAQVDRLIQRDALVHVVQQLDLVAELRPHVLEELGQHPHVRRRLPDRARVGRADGLVDWAPAAGAVLRAP